MCVHVRAIWLVLLGACASAPATPPRAPKAGEAFMSVVSFNVNYGLAGDPATLRAIGAADVDVVLLQEVNEAWEASIREAWGERWPHMTFHACCTAGGLAILSKRPIREAEILPAVTWFPALRAIVETPVGDVEVLNVHLRPPFSDEGSLVSGYFETPAIRRDEITAFLASSSNHPRLVAGDFNESNGPALEVLASRGFKNVLPELGRGAKTWRWNTSVGEVRSTLDHVWFDPALTPLDGRVLEIGRSDHFPIVSWFALAG